MPENQYILHAMDEDIWRIEENGVRSFVLVGKSKALVIDSGFGTGDILAAIKEITSLPLMLVNTHADRDHIGCNAQFSNAFMHPAEFDRYAHQGGDVSHARALWEGDVIELGGRSLEVVLIPGHTPGSIVLIERARQRLFSGDSIQSGTIFMCGAGRSAHAYIQSMKRIRDYIEGIERIHPSHGDIDVQPGIIPLLIDGMERVLSGQITPQTAEIPHGPVHVFDAGAAKFLMDIPEE